MTGPEVRLVLASDVALVVLALGFGFYQGVLVGAKRAVDVTLRKVRVHVMVRRWPWKAGRGWFSHLNMEIGRAIDTGPILLPISDGVERETQMQIEVRYSK